MCDLNVTQMLSMAIDSAAVDVELVDDDDEPLVTVAIAALLMTIVTAAAAAVDDLINYSLQSYCNKLNWMMEMTLMRLNLRAFYNLDPMLNQVMMMTLVNDLTSHLIRCLALPSFHEQGGGNGDDDTLDTLRLISIDWHTDDVREEKMYQ